MEKSKTIAISGVTGFLGSHLAAYFKSKDYKIIELTRSNFEPAHRCQLSLILDKADIIINLAGAPINKRWSKKYKIELHNSRIDTTKALIEAVNSLSKKPELFISASAVGYYSTLHSYDEYIARKGDNFLANLCDAWENEARKVSKDIRLVIARLGIVLSPDAKAFKLMTYPSRINISAVAGPGTQPFNWIDIDDVIGIIETIILDNKYKDVVNFVAPNKINYKEFVQKLAKHYNSFMTVYIPKLFFKITLGEASQFVCEGQRVKPTKLLEAGYEFRTRTIESFLSKIEK